MGVFVGWRAQYIEGDHTVPLFELFNEHGHKFVFESLLFANQHKDRQGTIVGVYTNVTHPSHSCIIERDEIRHDIGRKVALKLVHADDADHEIKAVKWVNKHHVPGIVPAEALDHGSECSYACVVMPLLHSTLHNMQMSMNDCERLGIFLLIICMLSEMLAKDVIYIDLKMANIMCTERGEWLFIDYGSLHRKGSLYGYSTYPPIEFMSGVDVECNEKSLLQIIGNFWVTLHSPRLERHIRYDRKIDLGREKVKRHCRSKVLDVCWGEECISLTNLIQELSTKHDTAPQIFAADGD